MSDEQSLLLRETISVGHLIEWIDEKRTKLLQKKASNEALARLAKRDDMRSFVTREAADATSQLLLLAELYEDLLADLRTQTEQRHADVQQVLAALEEREFEIYDTPEQADRSDR